MRLSEDELRKGIELCFNNASSLITDAETLLRKESYGHASFLAVSAIEETVKAYIYATNRIKGFWQPDELDSYVFKHNAKFALFLSHHFVDAVGKAIETERKEIGNPLDVDDLAEIGKDFDSAIKAIWDIRLLGLYVDHREGEWKSPSNIKREDAESCIEYAKKYKERMNIECRRILNVPLDLAKEVVEFIKNQLLPAYINQFYRNAEVLYKNEKITKRLYEVIMSKKEEREG